jgi:hypothetical protein
MTILHGREAAASEDEKVCLDRRWSGDENFLAHRQKGRGLIGGLTPNDNLTRRRLTYLPLFGAPFVFQCSAAARQPLRKTFAATLRRLNP